MTCAILIEDNLLDAQVEQITLRQVGFQVIHAPSNLDSEIHHMKLLGVTILPFPTHILDLHMSHPSISQQRNQTHELLHVHRRGIVTQSANCINELASRIRTWLQEHPTILSKNLSA